MEDPNQIESGYCASTQTFNYYQWAIPFDLHVLGMPPAFILSQDQTLNKKDYLFKNLKLFVSPKLLKIDFLLSFQRPFLHYFSLCISNISNQKSKVNKKVAFFCIFFTFFEKPFFYGYFSTIF